MVGFAKKSVVAVKSRVNKSFKRLGTIVRSQLRIDDKSSSENKEQTISRMQIKPINPLLSGNIS